MSNFKIKMNIQLDCYMISGQILHMNERYRNNLYHHDEKCDFTIESVSCPEFSNETLFVRGSNRSDDDRIFTKCFDTNYDLKNYLKNLEEILLKCFGYRHETIYSDIWEFG